MRVPPEVLGSWREVLHEVFVYIVGLVFFFFLVTHLAYGDTPQPATGFINVTETAGLGTTRAPTLGNPIWGDLNNDGYLDLFVSRHYIGYSLYKNNGDGTFTDMRVLNFSLSNTDLHVGAFADFNNDGYLDLHLVYGARGGLISGIKQDQHYLFTNSSFHPMLVPVADNRFGRAQSVSAVDFDNNRFVDIFVMNRGGPNVFYRNIDGTNFVDIAPALGLDDPEGLLGEFSSWADYDRDGDLDLLTGRTPGKTHLLRNDEGTFVEITYDAGLSPYAYCEAMAWGDYNNDGFMDLLLTRSGPENDLKNRLLRNNGNQTFTEVSDLSGVNQTRAYHYGVAWGDYDNDGYLDLFLVNPGQRQGSRVLNDQDTLYRNNGDGTFSDVSTVEGITSVVSGSGNGGAWGDYNNDGFLDLIVDNGKLWRVGGGNALYPRGQDVLYQNLGNPNHWLKVVPRGTTSNAAGIGVKVTITLHNGEQQFRELVSGGGGILRSQGHGPVHFGLGAATRVDSLVLIWPSGIVDQYTDIQADQIVVAVEGTGLTFQ
jgi:hypothetical protein